MEVTGGTTDFHVRGVTVDILVESKPKTTEEVEAERKGRDVKCVVVVVRLRRC